jgi:hypothetical protein
MYSHPFSSALSKMAADTLPEGYSPMSEAIPQMREKWKRIIEAKAKCEFGLKVEVLGLRLRFASVHLGTAKQEYSWSAIRNIAEKLALGKEHTFKISE